MDRWIVWTLFLKSFKTQHMNECNNIQLWRKMLGKTIHCVHLSIFGDLHMWSNSIFSTSLIQQLIFNIQHSMLCFVWP